MNEPKCIIEAMYSSTVVLSLATKDGKGGFPFGGFYAVFDYGEDGMIVKSRTWAGEAYTYILGDRKTQRLRDIIEFSRVPMAFKSNYYDVYDGFPHKVRINIGNDSVQYEWNGEFPEGWECIRELSSLITSFEPDEQQVSEECKPSSFMPDLKDMKLGRGAARLMRPGLSGNYILEAVSYTTDTTSNPQAAKCFGHRHCLSRLGHEEDSHEMCVTVIGEGDCLIDEWKLAWCDAFKINDILKYARVPLVFHNDDDDTTKDCRMLTVSCGNHAVVHRWYGDPPEGFEPLMDLVNLITRYGERILM